VERSTDLPDGGQISLINSHRFISLVRPSAVRNRLRLKTSFVSEFNLIWVAGPAPKYFSFRKSEIVLPFAHPAPTRGALAIVTNVGRDAVDATAQAARA
jgi:hypothetical protein